MVPLLMRRRRGGFNLIELLIGMFIFIVSMLGIVAVYPTAMQAITRGRDRMLGQMLAEQQMQAVLATPFSQQPKSPESFDVPLQCTVNGVQEVIEYHCDILVNNVATNLNDIVVTVTWAKGFEYVGSITYESESHQ
ncbi:MAG: type IV pilus modification PilV family protein [Candidatus Xenobia bacterium]